MSKIENLIKLVQNETCCLRCVGRGFGQKGVRESDSSLIKAKELPESVLTNVVEEDICSLCEGAVKRSKDLLSKILDKLRDHEYDSFLVGCKLSKRQGKLDENYGRYGIEPIKLKHEIAREIGMNISDHTQKNVDFINPDITIILEPSKTARFRFQIKSLYILGAYCKLIRGIPQTKWPCTYCKGRGCVECNNTGQQYPKSVEALIAKPFLVVSGSQTSSFHGAGREDIDALMLGDGRPFVLELKNPKKRNFDLKPLEVETNLSGSVRISKLTYCHKSTVKKIKEQSSDTSKTYRARIKLEQSPLQQNIIKLNNFGQKVNTIQQRTPLRVSHRRADKIREKKIYQVTILEHKTDFLSLEITAQGGAYIKEFISGDEGRSTPNISSILEVGAKCEELDVLSVDHKGLFI
ncbi:MAG: tRNA pseudouridine(54/55) synthase Pus10 [Candidatus Kariarchaeaceae archaeon]